MNIPIRESIRILLFNKNNALLLMCIDDSKTFSVNSQYLGRFWCTIGGGIEPQETIEEAALREIYEETGIEQKDIELGPIVWFGEFNLVLNGILTHLKQKFIVAKTTKDAVSFTKLDTWEAKVAQRLHWFSLDEITNTEEIIYPLLLKELLPEILKGNYPSKLLEIDLN